MQQDRYQPSVLSGCHQTAILPISINEQFELKKTYVINITHMLIAD